MKDFVVFDLETTGCNNADTIIEIGAWKFKNGVSIGKFSELVNPRCSISTTITQITGITNEMLSSQLELYEILPLFMSSVKIYLWLVTIYLLTTDF